jgi:urate oxidase
VHLMAEPWERVQVEGGDHGHAFVGGGGGRRTATVTFDGDAIHVVAGVQDLLLLKTTGSAFGGFLSERFTTMAETDDRIMATAVDARWRYAASDWTRARFDETWSAVRRALIETFATHDESRSVQHTLWAMGHAALAAAPDVIEMRLAMPNKHHLLVDLTPYGLDNPGEVFVATDRPFGLIEGTVVWSGSTAAPEAW